MELWYDFEIIEKNGKKWLNHEASNRLYIAYQDKFAEDVKGKLFSLAYAEKVVNAFKPTKEMYDAIIIDDFKLQRQKANISLYEYLPTILRRIPNLNKLMGKTGFTNDDLIAFGILIQSQVADVEFDKDNFLTMQKQRGIMSLIGSCKTSRELLDKVNSMEQLYQIICVFDKENIIKYLNFAEDIVAELDEKNYFVQADYSKYIAKIMESDGRTSSQITKILEDRYQLSKEEMLKGLKEGKSLADIAKNNNQMEDIIKLISDYIDKYDNPSSSIPRNVWVVQLIMELRENYNLSDDELNRLLVDNHIVLVTDFENALNLSNDVARYNNLAVNDLLNERLLKYNFEEELYYIYNTVTPNKWEQIKNRLIGFINLNILQSNIVKGQEETLYDLYTMIMSLNRFDLNYPSENILDQLSERLDVKKDTILKVISNYNQPIDEIINNLRVMASKALNNNRFDEIDEIFNVCPLIRKKIITKELLDSASLSIEDFKAQLVFSRLKQSKGINDVHLLDLIKAMFNSDYDAVKDMPVETIERYKEIIKNYDWYNAEFINNLLSDEYFRDDDDDSLDDLGDEPRENVFQIIRRRKAENPEEHKKVLYGVVAGVGVISCVFMTKCLNYNPINVITECAATIGRLLTGNAYFTELLGKLGNLTMYYGSIVAGIVGGRKFANTLYKDDDIETEDREYDKENNSDNINNDLENEVIDLDNDDLGLLDGIYKRGR